MSNVHRLLICTVGGSHAPLVASIRHWKPARIVFVTSVETRPVIEQKIAPDLSAVGVELNPGAYEVCVLDSPQNLEHCLATLRGVNPEVERWLSRGDAFQAVVDFTGGTKCMTAALAILAHDWQCNFSYVGGAERTKGGQGVVVDGTEQVVDSYNPWMTLGLHAAAKATVLFDRGAYAAARMLAEAARQRQPNESRKRELNVLSQLASVYDQWDRFEHGAAARELRTVQKSANDLHSLIGNRERSERLLRTFESHAALLDRLHAAPGPRRDVVGDLLANARRRQDEGRYDDAVARLYRGVEAIAQVRLLEAHGLPDTGAVPLERLPADLRGKWEIKSQDGLLKLGLQDDFELLRALGDPLGARFQELGLGDPQRSSLVARNQSILAHGFEPVGEKICKQLCRAALELAELRADELPQFPRLGAES